MTMDSATFALFLAALLFGTVAGAGLYQLVAVMPTWFSSPPESFSAIGGKRDRTFWIPLQSAALLSLVFAVITNWGIAERRTSLLVAAAANVLVWIATGVYFVPEILKFTKMPKDAPATPEARRPGPPMAQAAVGPDRSSRRRTGRNLARTLISRARLNGPER